MIVVVLCTANQQDEILKKQTAADVQFVFTSSANEFETSTGDVFSIYYLMKSIQLFQKP